MADIKIFFKKGNKVEVQLRRGRHVLDVHLLPLDERFDTDLLISIDKLLKRNRIHSASLKKVKVGGRPLSHSTSARIASAAASALSLHF